MAGDRKKTLNRSDLLRVLGQKYPHLDARILEQCIDAVFSAVSDALANGKRVELRGFGTFSTKQRATRTTRNPKTGEEILTEGKRVPAFRPGQKLRDTLIRAALAETKARAGAGGKVDDSGGGDSGGDSGGGDDKPVRGPRSV